MIRHYINIDCIIGGVGAHDEGNCGGDAGDRHGQIVDEADRDHRERRQQLVDADQQASRRRLERVADACSRLFTVRISP